jgi:acetyl/propionyl-CoA carboxylase alpha subunit
VAVLGDRDCSLQRRRQKLIEIAPAAIGEAIRARLSAAAVALAASIRYAGLATVEFLVQADTIAFLEVNPRLQVEHTVTEQVTGLDLVELALRVADGARLGDLPLDAGPPRGVAVQARVNTETLRPDGTLQPGGGTLSRFQPPAGRGVRVDTAGYRGYVLNPRYDSLLAKVITNGATLGEAARRAVRALAEFDIAGVPVNTALLQALLQAPGLGRLEVGWVDAHAAELAAARPISLAPPADPVLPADPAPPRPARPPAPARPLGPARCRPVTPRCARRWRARSCRSWSGRASWSPPATNCSSSRR